MALISRDPLELVAAMGETAVSDGMLLFWARCSRRCRIAMRRAAAASQAGRPRDDRQRTPRRWSAPSGAATTPCVDLRLAG
jgi:hypothetical protein